MSDEESKAKAAAAASPPVGKNLFQRIIDREIPADVIYEDEHVSGSFHKWRHVKRGVDGG